VKTFALLLLLLLPATLFAEAAQPNWTGKYPLCNRHSDLLNREHLDLGVRIATLNPVLARQFARAMEFWTAILDLEWHEVDSQDCSIQLLDGTPDLFDFNGRCECLSARAQFPDRLGFEGWIAFNPGLKFTRKDMYLDSVHEIGHLLGLRHNPNDLSVMSASEFDKSVSLDATDLDALSARHKLRAGILEKGGVTDVRVLPSTQTASGGRTWFRGIARWKRPLRAG
jgi:hypothetical protein